MKFKAAVIVSVIFHLSLVAIALYAPGKGGRSGTVYYVDLVSLPGGGGKGGSGKGGGGTRVEAEPQGMKDLTVKKQEPEPTSTLRYPDEKNKKQQEKEKKKKKEEKSLITIVKKEREKPGKSTPLTTITRRQGEGDNTLKTGISAGSGGGEGGGVGSGYGEGYGDGSGIGDGSFPYAYYIATLRNKISSSWYNALISPGIRGKFMAVVYFKIMRSGQIRDLELTGKSGISTLDLSSLRAIENAAPFPPLPNDYPDYYLGVYFEFVWEKK